MVKLHVKSNGQTVSEIELKSGPNYFGRSVDSDFQIVDASVSSHHCEVIFDDGRIQVRDLGSTNGTFVDGMKVQESVLRPGQILRLGNVDIVCAEQQEAIAPAQASTVATSVSGLRVAPVTGPTRPPIIPFDQRPAARAYLSDPTRNAGSFFQQLPSAFAYPFKRNGIMLLVSGSIFFAAINFLLTGPSIRIAFFLGRVLVGMLILVIIGFGYFSAYVQKIITTSAQGEDDLPSWPEFSNFWDDLIHPAMLVIASFLASFCPLMALLYFGGELDPEIRLVIGLACGLFACAYLPMALLATSMYDTTMAVNPLLIIPSMVKIPKEYFVACLTLAMIILVRVGCDYLLRLIPIYIIPGAIAGFLSLYFTCVEMRILGLIYNSKREDLNWSF